MYANAHAVNTMQICFGFSVPYAHVQKLIEKCLFPALFDQFLQFFFTLKHDAVKCKIADSEIAKNTKYRAYLAVLPVGCSMHNCFEKWQNYPFNWKNTFCPAVVCGYMHAHSVCVSNCVHTDAQICLCACLGDLIE